MDVAILLYHGVTALDAIGPYEVLHMMPDANVRFVAKQRGLVQADSGMLRLSADNTLKAAPAPDILLVPGTPHPQALTGDEEVLAWIRRHHETSKWTTSVCTGAVALGAAGVLSGKRATTHWLAMDMLSEFGATPTAERVVTDGKIMTAAGVSSGIDMALTLVAAEYGAETAQQIQLIIEYDPKPPFDAGAPDKAPAAITDRLRARYGNLS